MLSALVRPSIKADVSWSAYDPRWYSDIGGMRADAGVTIVPESALGIAAVYRAVNVLAHSVASIPLPIYRRLDDGGKERDREHPSYGLLHDRPNTWTTSFRWRHLLMTQAILWGNHYSEIIPGVGGIGGLVPLSPDTTRIVDQMNDGRLLYVTRDVTAKGLGAERRLTQDEILHVRGFSLDGKSGLPLVKFAKNAMGLSLAAERHGSMFMKRGARLAGMLTSAAPMKEPERKENEAAWQRQYGGADGTGGTPLLTGGLEFKPISSNNRDSQWLEARTFQVEELLRFIGVPGVLVGYVDKTATYASAEQFFQSFVTHSVQPWTENISAELNGSVVTGFPEFFAEFVLEGLLKGDIKTRYAAHQQAIMSGWKSRNEARIEENYNRGPDELDEFLVPLNVDEAGADRGSSSAPPSEGQAQLAAIVTRSVERLVRKEVAAIVGKGGRLGAAARFADNAEGWSGWLEVFYAEHAVRISEDLDMSLPLAEGYCAVQLERFATLGDMDTAESESIAALLRLTPAKRIAA